MVVVDRRLAIKRPLVFKQFAPVSVSLGFTRGKWELTSDEAIPHSFTILGSQALSWKGRLCSFENPKGMHDFKFAFVGCRLFQERERRILFACGWKDCKPWKTRDPYHPSN